VLKIWLRRGVVAGALGVAVAVLAMAGGDLWVRGAAFGHTYTEATVPAAPVALVLGAQVYADGTPSPFLAARLDIARRLLADGKVRAILVSGDHGRWEYSETGAMAQWLREHGVPAQRIAVDYAGFDTYDSCARAIRIFGVRQLIVVTQSYHVDRAVTLCRHVGIDASGVGDDTVRGQWDPWWHSTAREHLACVKAVFDMATGRNPVFLGRHETGVEDALRASP
jgi:vancomycin permeability regulator SanA